MNNLNPYQGYEYVFQMNSVPYPVKMEEPYCDPDPERDELQNPHGTLPYMSTFAKHGTPSMAMFYPQLTYDLHPLMLNHRRRSGPHEKLEMTEPLDDSNAIHGASLGGMHLKDGRYKPTKLKVPTKRRGHELHDDHFVLPDNSQMVLDESNNPDFAAKNRKAFFCRSCGKTFKFQTSLLRHNNKVHISKYQCPTCSRVFSRQAYLDVHTSKQGSSCYLDPALRMPRGRPQLQPLSATSD